MRKAQLSKAQSSKFKVQSKDMDILQYTFFQNALIGALLASILCGFVGTYIVTRRLVFISGGITHASFGGIGIGVFTGINPILSAMVFAILERLRSAMDITQERCAQRTPPSPCSGPWE